MKTPTSRSKRLAAVATTALVAALPVFPLFADEPAPSDAAAPQAASAQRLDGLAPRTFVIPDLNAAFADFNVSLLEIPDGESVEFYRQRAAALQVEWSRCTTPYLLKLEKAARENADRVR